MLYLNGVGEIRLVEHGVFQLCRKGFCRFLVFVVMQDHAVALSVEGLCRRLADAAGGTCDEYGFHKIRLR